MNIFRTIFKMMDESNKDYQIRHSGSVKGKTNEKNLSGLSYLYKTQGMESEVLEIKFKDRISLSNLQRALTDSARRYPYLFSKIIEKDGEFYFVKNDVTPIAERRKNLRKLGSIETSYHLVDITSYDKSIYVSFHHALTDGRGIIPFLETLIYYYSKFKYNSTALSDGIRLKDDPLLDGETDEPFSDFFSYEKKERKTISRDAFAITETDDVREESFRFELTVGNEEFLKVAKENNATPAILITYIMNKAIANVHPDFDKPINANIAMDIRAAIGYPNTFKNAVRTVILPYTKEDVNKNLKDIAQEYREIIKSERDEDIAKEDANMMVGLFKKLTETEGMENKIKMMSFFEQMRLDTYIISYLGKIRTNGNERYIDSIMLYNSGTAGLGINMIALEDKFCLTVKQSFKSDEYLKEFISTASSLGLNFKASEEIEFTTPKDRLIRRSC